MNKFSLIVLPLTLCVFTIGCGKGLEKEYEEVKNIEDSVVDKVVEVKDTVMNTPPKDLLDFNFAPYIDRIERISEVDTFSKMNKNVKSLLLKGEYDSSTYYIIKVGVDTKYRFQTVYNFYVDSITHKLFFLDVFNNSLIEIKNGVRLLPKSRIMSGY